MPFSDKQEQKDYARRYRTAHTTERREYGREWRKRRELADPEFKRRARETERLYRERHPEKVRAKNARNKMLTRDANLKIKYGITHQDYERMLLEQQDSCAICGSKTPGKRCQYFCVDHDHATGKVRGLLCTPCNTALGALRDNAHTLRLAIAYLERQLQG